MSSPLYSQLPGLRKGSSRGSFRSRPKTTGSAAARAANPQMRRRPEDLGARGGADRSPTVPSTASYHRVGSLRRPGTSGSLRSPLSTHSMRGAPDPAMPPPKTSFGNAKALALAARVDAPHLVKKMTKRHMTPHVTPFMHAPQYGESLTEADIRRLDVTEPASHPAERARQKAALAERAAKAHAASSYSLGKTPGLGGFGSGTGFTKGRYNASFRSIGGAQIGAGFGSGNGAAWDTGTDEAPIWGDSSTDGSSGGGSIGVETDMIDLLRKAWNATHHRTVLDAHGLSFPSIKGNEGLATVLADWVDGMEDSNRQHNTVQLFLQKKMAGVEAKIVQATVPNRVRTAVCVGLLDNLILRARALAPALVSVRHDLMTSIFHLKALQKAGLDWSGYRYHTKRMGTKETMERLLKVPTYFDLLDKCEGELAHEKLMRRKDAEKAYKVGIRDATVEARFREKRRERLRMSYERWARVAKFKKMERHMYGEFQKKMQLMALMKPKPSKYNSQAVFNAWRLFVALQQHQKLEDQLAHSADDGTKLLSQLNATQKELAACRAHVVELQDQCAHLNEQYESLQQAAHERIHGLRKVVCSTARALDVTGRTCLAMMRGMANQVEANPDARKLVRMLSPKDVHPERTEVVPEYKYEGDGTGDGGATETLAADGEPFDPYKMYDRIDGADAFAVSRRSEKHQHGGAGSGHGTALGGKEEEEDDDAFGHTGYGSDTAGDAGMHTAEDELARIKQQAEAQLRRDLDEHSPKELEDKWEAEMVRRLRRDGEAHEDRQAERQQRYRERMIEINALRRLSPDMALLQWMNYQLKLHTADEGLPRRIHNFGRDVADGEAWTAVLAQVAWQPSSYKALSAQDSSHRCELVAAQLATLEPTAINFATAEHIAAGDAPINSALAARLFTTHSGLAPGKEPAEKLATEIDEAVSAFKGLGDCFRSMKFAAHRWEEAESLEMEFKATGTTKRRVRGKDMWKGRGMGNGLRKNQDVNPDLVDTWCKQLQVSAERVGETLVLSRAGKSLWDHLCQRVTDHTWKVFESKLLHVGNMAIVDERAARDLEEYTVLIPIRYKDILDRYCKSQEHAAAELELLQTELRHARSGLARIFQYYSASGDGSSISTMTVNEYWAMLRDAKVATSGHGDHKSARLDLIFIKVNQTAGLPADRVIKDGELTPRQWVESLIRVAVLLNERTRPAVAPHESLHNLLDKKVLQYATQSNTDNFREELGTRDVRNVFKRHRVTLQRVFTHYSGIVATSPTMSEGDYFQLMKDCMLVDGHLTPLQLRHVFAHTQLEEEFLEDSALGGGEDAMVYSEFLEGLAATAHHKLCSPYVCMAKRVETFITDYILPNAHQKNRKMKRRHSPKRAALVDAPGGKKEE